MPCHGWLITCDTVVAWCGHEAPAPCDHDRLARIYGMVPLTVPGNKASGSQRLLIDIREHLIDRDGLGPFLCPSNI